MFCDELVLSLEISLTGAMPKSLCNISFVTYHGACVMSRSVFY
jgi:hypothetical protein